MSHDPEKSGLQFDHASEATCSESDTSTNPADDSHVEAGVVRRLDLVVVPLLAFSMMIAYMVSFPITSNQQDARVDQCRIVATLAMPVFWACKRTCT